MHSIESGLRRVRNCVGKLALRFEMVYSYGHSTCVSLTVAIHISCLVYSDPTRAIVVTGVLHCVTVSGQSYPTKGLPYSIIHRLVATPFFNNIMYLYSICLVSTTCCDATITKHMCNTNI